MITSNEKVTITAENNSSHEKTRRMYKLSLIPNVKVLNASWYNSTDCAGSVIESLVFEEIQSRGVFVVAATGNGSTCGNAYSKVYPAAYPSVFAVTSVGHLYDYEGQEIGPNSYEIKDVHIGYNFNQDKIVSHNHYSEVDISAIGYSNLVANYSDAFEVGWGTSFSSPMVAGAAILMYSINPNLTPQQVGNILKETADDIYHIPENKPFQGLLGAGRLNVFRAVKTVQ